VGDYTRDRALVAQTNQLVTAREALATEATNNPANDTFARNKADFDTNMNNAEIDYTAALARAVAAHNTALLDMAANLNTSRTRAYNSLANFGKEIDVTATNAEGILNGIFDGMPAAAKTKAGETITAFINAFKNYKPDPVVIPTSLGTPAGLTDKQINESSEMHAKAEQRIQAQSKITAVEGSMGHTIGGNLVWRHNDSWYMFAKKQKDYPDLIKQLENGKDPNGIDKSFWEKKGKLSVKNLNGDTYMYADGGIVRGPGSGNSDSINARLSNGEYVVKADAVRKYGQSFLDNVNAQKLTHASYVNGVDSKMSSMQGYSTNVTNSTTTQNDHSTQINGQITVQAQDPNEFMRKIQAKQRRQRLIQPVGN